MSQKTKRTLYWITTSLLALGMLGAGIQETRRAPEILEAAHRLGYPDYFITLLGIAKLAGAPMLVVPHIVRLREWVYAGFAFDFGGAVISHTVVGDTLVQTLPAAACLVLLAVSYGLLSARGEIAPEQAP